MEERYTLPDGRTLLLRPPTQDDALALIAFHKRAGGETDFLLSDSDGIPGLTEESERAYIEETLGMANTAMWLGFVEGELIALCDVRAMQRPRVMHNGGVGLVVRRDFWGKGVGSALMRTLTDFAKANGTLTRLALDVRADNARAIGLYKRFGFVECGRAHRYMCVGGDYYDMIQMELLL